MRQRLLEASGELLVERGWSGTSTTLVSKRPASPAARKLHHSDQGRTGPRRRRAPGAKSRAEPPTPPRVADRAAHPAMLEMLAEHFHRPGVHRRPRALGRGPHRPDLHAAVGPLSSGSAARSTGAPSSCSAPTRAAGGPRAGAGHPRPGPPGSGQHDQRRHRPPGPDPRPVGPRPGRPADPADPAAEAAMTPRPQRIAPPTHRAGDRLADVLADLARRATRSTRPSRTSPHPAGAPRPRRPAWTIPTRSPTWPGPKWWSGGHRRHRQGRLGGVVLAALEDPDGAVDAEAAQAPRPTRRPARSPVAGHLAGPGRHVARPRGARPAPAPMEATPRWPPRASWRPGRTRRPPTHSGYAGRADRPVRHVVHLGVLPAKPPLRRPRRLRRPSRPDPRGPRAARRRSPRGPADRRSPVRCAGRHGLALLVTPARPPRRHRPGRARGRFGTPTSVDVAQAFAGPSVRCLPARWT